MQSANQQVENRFDAQRSGSYRPERFERPVAQSAAAVQPVDYPIADEQRHEAGEPREVLAAAFRRLGRAMGADAAFARARDFYKSSRNRWTHGLR
jgi:hypothetical protein